VRRLGLRRVLRNQRLRNRSQQNHPGSDRTMILCPKCSFDNELGPDFLSSMRCQADLDIDQADERTGRMSDGRSRRVRGASAHRNRGRPAGGIPSGDLFDELERPRFSLETTNADLMATDNKRVSLERVIYQGNRWRRRYVERSRPPKLQHLSETAKDGTSRVKQGLQRRANRLAG